MLFCWGFLLARIASGDQPSVESAWQQLSTRSRHQEPGRVRDRLSCTLQNRCLDIEGSIQLSGASWGVPTYFGISSIRSKSASNSTALEIKSLAQINPSLTLSLDWRESCLISSRFRVCHSQIF